MNSSAGKIGKILARGLIMLLVGFFINGCSVEPNSGRSIYMAYGYSEQDTSSMSIEQLLNEMRGTVTKTTTGGKSTGLQSGTSVGSVYPFPSKVTLDMTATSSDESVIYNAAEINEKYNDNQFTIESDGSLNIPYTSFSLVIPSEFTVDFILTIYNAAGYQYFQGVLTIGPNDTIDTTVVFPLGVAIDPSIPIYCTGSNDTDGDGLCNVYEDMFVNALGQPNIDNQADGNNSNDTDSDDDGILDSDEGILPSNDGFPRFVHANNAPTSADASFTTSINQPITDQSIAIIDPDVGDTHSISIVTNGSNGVATINSNLFSYTPNTNYTGTDTFTISATDDGGLSVTGTVSITINSAGNLIPIANSQSLNIDEDTILTGTLSGSDGDGSISSYTCSQPGNGVVDCSGAPNFSYTPNTNFNGVDSFTFTVTDNSGATSSLATVSITVNSVNDSPVATDDATPRNHYLLSQAYIDGIDGNTSQTAISETGRYIAFWTDSSNLGGTLNKKPNLYLMDTQGSSITLITDNASSAPASLDLAARPSISQNGRYTFFISPDTTLDPGITSLHADTYLYDNLDKTITNISSGGECTSTGTDNDAYEVRATQNGQYVAISTLASNTPGCGGNDFSLGDTNGKLDVYLLDTVGGFDQAVSVDAAGTNSDGDSYSPAVSDDAAFVAFVSTSTNLNANDKNATEDVYLKDTSIGSLTVVSYNGTSSGDGASRNPSVSADGKSVAFESDATNLVSGDNNSKTDIFLWTPGPKLTRISVDSSGSEANDSSYNPQISKDGRYVIFTSNATNLVSNDYNGVSDMFIHDTVTGLTERLTEDQSGIGANGNNTLPAWSGNGQYVVFTSSATNLDSTISDNNGFDDVVELTLTDMSTTSTDTLTTYDLTLNDNDIDGDTISVNTMDSTSYGGGTITNNGDNTANYTATSGFQGLDIFNYGITDGNGGTDSGAARIAVGLDYVPIGKSDSYTTSVGTPIDLDVMTNDSDANGDSLAIDTVSATTLADGTVTINGNLIRYTPPSTATGLDSFTYTLKDSRGNPSQSVYVTVTVN